VTAERSTRALIPMEVDQDGIPIVGVVEPAGPDAAAPAGSAVERRRPGRLLPWRPVGRWWSGDQDGRVYVLGRPKPRDGEPAGPGRLPRWALRTVWRMGRGHLVIGRRAWDALTHAAIREQIRTARAAGDREALGVWIDRLDAIRSGRRQRLRELPAAAGGLAVGAGLAAGSGGVFVGGGGIVVAATHPAGWDWSDWWSFWAAVVHWGATAVVIGLLVAVALAVPGWLYGTWHAGRLDGVMPGWLSPALASEHEDVPITPSLVVTALRDLGISDLTKKIKAMPDHGAGMLSLIKVAGCGVELDIALPSGTETADVRKRHSKLAENLYRHEHELHLTIPKRARTIRAWIADPGALDEPIGPSPLVYDQDMQADYYTGRAPWGEDLRGDAVALLLKQCHMLVTGLSNQGKTAALRALLLWLAFDPSVEFWIGDLKGIGDWGMFRGLATVLIEGPTDEHVVAVTHMVEAGVAEMNRRTLAVQDMATAKGVTREMARAGSGLHPLKIVVDEAQIAFMSPEVGEDGRPYGGRGARSRFFQAVRQIQNQGRAVNVTIDLGTQDPTNDNLPKIVREAFHIRASLFVGTESQARMALGEAAVDGGAAPHKLRRGLDRGTLVVTGDGVPLPTGAASMTVRTHYIDGDEATEIAERAKARRDPVDTASPVDVEAPRDLLDDLDLVLGTEPIKSADVPARLRKLAPDHPAYRNLTGVQLREWLAEEGVKVPSTGNLWPLDPAAVRTAIAVRGALARDAE